MAEMVDLDEALRVAEFVVEASSFETQALWERFADDAKDLVPRMNEARIDWKDQSRGWLVTVGMLDQRPVCVSLSISTLNGHAVLFYEVTSEVVDHAQIEDWFRERCWPLWDHGTRRAHCNAMNFHHCLEICRAQLNDGDNHE